MDPERFRADTQSSWGNRYNDIPDLPQPPPHNYAPKKQGGHKWLPWVIVVVSLIILGGLGYVVYKGYKPKATANHSTKNQTAVAPKKASTKPKSPAVPTTSYTSTNFNTTFSYPTGWNVVDSGSAPLTVTSTPMNIISDKGQSVLGEVVLTLAKKGTVPPELGTQSVAVMNSIKISFTSPSTTQAAQAYVSFVQYPTTTTVGGLNAIYLTGNYGYQKYQSIPGSDIAAIDPLVYFSFYSCASQQCPISTRKPLTIASTDWKDTSFSDPIINIIKSFDFT